MGLAASQARLLTITARKSDCEFESMSLSHQKLALARDMESVSTEYQNALNTTKLTYDYYGSGTSDMDLTYDLLMTPSIYNDYYPKLITDSTNRVILNSQYAAAAKAAGIPAEGLSGTPSSNVRNRFIEGLVSEGVITSTMGAALEGITYNNAVGNGSTSTVVATTTDCSYDELVELIAAYGTSTSDYGIILGGEDDRYNYGEEYLSVYTADGIRTCYDSDSGSADISLADLLSGDTEYILTVFTNEEAPVDATSNLQEKILESGGILDWLYDNFAAVLGGTTASEAALQYAYNQIYDLIYPSDNLEEWISDNSYTGKDDGDRGEKTELLEEIGTVKSMSDENKKFYTNVEEDSSDYLGFYCNTAHSGGWHSDSNNWTQVSINLNNLAQAFLTAYVDYMTELEEGYSYSTGSLSDCNLYDPDTSDYTFTIVTETEIDEDTELYAAFYDALFNRICLQGWVENDQIDDSDYMSELLKNGMAYISSISDDGYYYQGNYSTDSMILEETDDAAIAKAEIKYETEKTKIENKEDTIDLKIKNLDTEISSLTTEYDTTKSIISKSIEKSFKRYDA